MANSVDPDQTAETVHADCFYTLFVSNARQLFAADDFSRRNFQMHFFLGTLRANSIYENLGIWCTIHHSSSLLKHLTNYTQISCGDFFGLGKGSLFIYSWQRGLPMIATTIYS